MRRPARVRRGGERGVALIEMAVAVGLLSLFLFGIITFGVTLSFDQNLTQASNEAARVAAVAPTQELARERAAAAVDRVIGGWGVSCGDGALDCGSFVIDACEGDPGADCMTVDLVYDLEGHPRVPSIPVVAQALPDTLEARVVVQVAAEDDG